MATKKITVAKGMKMPKKMVTALRKKAGSSNIGKYKAVAKDSFCGPAGGSAKGTFPVNSKKRAHAALAYAHNAPNPAGIKRCVKKKFPSMDKKSKKK